MDPNQTPPQVGVNSGSTGASATGKSIFANPQNRFKDTNPNGDIIIPPSGGSGSGSGGSGPKKPLNKKLIIGIVIAAVLAVAAIVLVVINLDKGSSTSTSTSSGDEVSADVSADVAEAFNKYANFIISGEASTERMPSEDELDGFLVVSKIIDGDMEFMNEAKSLFDSFYNTFQENADDYPPEVTGIIDNYKQLFDAMYKYAETGVYPEDASQSELEDVLFDCYDIEESFEAIDQEDGEEDES